MAISPELILGLWGSVTGTVSVLILVLKYLKEKPKIEAELIDPKHYYQPRGKEQKDYFLTLSIGVRLTNTGDKGTTIGYAELDFKVGKQIYKAPQSQMFGRDERIARVGPNDMVEVHSDFDFPSSYDKDPKQEEIPFKLVLYHTHGEIKLEGISKIG